MKDNLEACLSWKLWKDLGNWHSALRKKACVFVSQHYHIAKGLLGDHGVFLRHGIDEEEHTNNLAHPVLSSLIINFFYTGSLSVGQLFPEVFGEEVLRVAIAIAATVLKVGLDKMASSQVYLEMLGLMNKCDTSVIHAKKMKSLQCEWEIVGSNGTKDNDIAMVVTASFDVDLD
ncbi:hypothetical protein V8B97DRAFT_2026304 [Scleroderma yunnanense]